MGWWEYTRAEHLSQACQDFLVNISTGLVVARGKEISTRTMAQILEAFIYGFLKRNLDGPIDRMLNRPTDEAWITPWVSYLSSLGVEFKLDAKVTKLSYASGNITGATITDSAGNNGNITAYWCVLAILDTNKDSATRAIIYARYKFPLLSLEHLIDDKLYRLGLPNKNDLLHPYFPEK